MLTAGPVYIVRHGQTDWNAEGRFQGQRDIPLNETGRGQASRNGAALRRLIGRDDLPFDFVASPLARTRETMERLRSAMDLEPFEYRTDKALVELSFGDWEGYTFQELLHRYPADIARREHDKWHFLPPGAHAESYEILSWRVSGWLASVRGPTVCVTHGGVIRTLLKLTGQASEAEASAADIHQDRLLVLEAGRLAWLEETTASPG